MLKVLLISVSLLAGNAAAQDSLRYRCPRGNAVLPASCLEEMKVLAVNRRLSPKERHQLAYLFAKSYIVSKVKYHQDYPLSPTASVTRLLRASFPEAGHLEKEGGLWLGDIFNFFRAQRQYQRDVARAVHELPRKQRRQFAR
jgi:hypothetical protein